MNALETTEEKRYRNLGNALRALVLLGMLAGIATIAAQAPERDYANLRCAYDPAATGSLVDAAPAIPDLCATPAPAAALAPRGGFGVPDAAKAVGSASNDEVQPPTF